MGKIGYGYGSEWQLLRYLGYHRDFLNNQILLITGGDRIAWLDFGFTLTNKPLKQDKEWIGLDFIEDPVVQGQWHAFWPQSGTAQNWDAVGALDIQGRQEWLLVEANAHLGEVKSTCGARNPNSLDKIKSLSLSYG